MMKTKHFLLILAVLLVNFSSVNSTFKKRLKIVDGDTIHLGKVKYRLYGIDAPEIKQNVNLKK